MRKESNLKRKIDCWQALSSEKHPYTITALYGICRKPFLFKVSHYHVTLYSLDVFFSIAILFDKNSTILQDLVLGSKMKHSYLGPSKS